jgi:hypothetical protein
MNFYHWYTTSALSVLCLGDFTFDTEAASDVGDPVLSSVFLQLNGTTRSSNPINRCKRMRCLIDPFIMIRFKDEEMVKMKDSLKRGEEAATKIQQDTWTCCKQGPYFN